MSSEDVLLKIDTRYCKNWVICSADGAGVREGDGGVGDGEGGDGVDCWVFEAKQWSQVQYLFLRYCAAFKSPEHFACTHPEHLVHR